MSKRAFDSACFALVSAICAEALFFSFVETRTLQAIIGRIALSSLTLHVIFRFCLFAFTPYKPKINNLFTLIGVLCAFLGIVWFCKILALSLSVYIPNLSETSVYFYFPFAAGALLLQAILGAEYALVFSLSMASLVTLYTPFSFFIFPLIAITSLVGCIRFSKIRTRSSFLGAGLRISTVALLIAFGSILIDPTLTLNDAIIRITGALASGLLVALLASGISPLIEYLGGYVTDIRLLEIATFDHPLLKELSIQAPGTWNHSMVMGMMVEAAAEATGANPIIARVGAYFHDIGKMKKPLYFVENQLPGENRHDKLSPSMSALIIKAHVRDGLDMARAHKLPDVLLDAISQHHGTSLIEYFYDKALKEAETTEKTSELDKALYTYPGPKPQTRECGILMLADAIEAACRTVQDPTVDKIQGLVQKLVNKIFSTGQLDECELTLKDLHQIAKCFTRVLASIHHQRIAYNEPAEKVSSSAPQEDKDILSDSAKPTKPPKKEALKRLGM